MFFFMKSILSPPMNLASVGGWSLFQETWAGERGEEEREIQVNMCRDSS